LFQQTISIVPRRLLDALPVLTVAAAWCLTLLVVGWIVAGWFWDMTAPAPLSVPVTGSADPLQAAHAVAARHLMGTAKSASASGAAAGGANYHLLGVMTSSGGSPGFAILAEEGKPPSPVVEGEEVAAGILLQRITPRAVELRRQGTTETVELREKSAMSPSS
jgi:hypothetical protein